jgi:GDP-L-fucose synthase
VLSVKREDLTLRTTHLAQKTNSLKYVNLDLLDQKAVENFFEKEKPEYVILAAAKVGGIVANNTNRADFIYENLQIQNNVIHQSYVHKVKKLLFLGSTCIYPKNAPQPMSEECLLTSPLEYTNEPYAIAKIAGIKMCESYNIQYGTNFISVMPTNLYGPNDNFDLEKSHVLPALIRKIHLGKYLESVKWEELYPTCSLETEVSAFSARSVKSDENWEKIKEDLNKNPIEGITGKDSKEKILNILEKYGIKLLNTTHLALSTSIEIWGSGSPKREFLYSEDMADACVFIIEKINFFDMCKDTQEIRNTHINIGTGKDISIKELALLIKNIIGYQGELVFNTNKPDGTLEKLTNVSKLHELGWHHKIELKEGIKLMYEWYKNEK